MLTAFNVTVRSRTTLLRSVIPALVAHVEGKASEHLKRAHGVAISLDGGRRPTAENFCMYGRTLSVNRTRTCTALLYVYAAPVRRPAMAQRMVRHGPPPHRVRAYYLPEALRYLSETEWARMGIDVTSKLSQIAQWEFSQALFQDLQDVPDDGAWHIPGNFYWRHACRIFLHYLVKRLSSSEFPDRFPSVKHTTYASIIDYVFRLVLSLASTARTLSLQLARSDRFVGKWVCLLDYLKRDALGAKHLDGYLRAEEGQRGSVSLIVRSVCVCMCV